jgi:DNA-binding response OmpR family regulator
MAGAGEWTLAPAFAGLQGIGMRVLVVEDFEPLRESIAQGLREAGYAVDTAADGRNGLWHAESGDHDVIVLDLMLPGIDGWSIIKKLREKKSPAHILVLTAKDTSQDKVRGLELGADDYLIKPFDFAELLARVRTLIRRKYETNTTVLQIADLRIDTSRRTVRRGDQTVELTAREYALLEYLGHNAGAIVSRSEIWKHVYDFNAEIESNVVDVFIGLLRRKVEKPGLPRLIHTRRGQGYLLGTAGAEE